MLPIFIADTAPGATGHPLARNWLSICHGQQGRKFLHISHQPHRSPSRHTYAENKRPFRVALHSRGPASMPCGHAATLAGALKIANRIARELA